MDKYIIANWKSHKTEIEAKEWVDKWLSIYQQVMNVKTIVAPALVYVKAVSEHLEKLKPLGVYVATQDISPFPFGAYTGAVAAVMVKDWVSYAIVGHSERRKYFHETDQEVANKVRQLLEVGIKPIVCVDKPYLKSQINALEDKDRKEVLIAYEPLEAIGSGVPEDPQEVEMVVNEIKMEIDVPVIYGGSVNAGNAKKYLEVPGVQGLLVGGASLDPEEFYRICEQGK
jgi:triosephosphate isomerase